MQIHEKVTANLVLVLVFVILLAGPARVHSSVDLAARSASSAETSDLWSQSNITLPTVQNLTIAPSNFSVVDLSSQMDPTRSVIDVVRGFEPVERFNSEFSSALVRKAHVGNCSLTRIDDELRIFLNASSEYDAAIARYKLSFTTPILISEGDSISFALSTSDDYNSSEAYIGISLLLRDQQGNRHYISVQVSDQYREDSFFMSKWFLGWTVDLTKECPNYPHYDMRYNSAFGPWFIQLPLSDSFEALNLSSALLDGLLVGGEIFSRPPFDIEEITEVNTRFRYILVHRQPFTINQEMVNSTTMAFPFSSSLSFSGISGKSVNVIVEGSLKPVYRNVERLKNETVVIRETLFDLSQTLEGETSVQGNVKIDVFGKAVSECIITLDNKTEIDVTDSLLRSNTLLHQFPSNTTALEVRLILYKFNAWFFTFSIFQPSGMTKRGILEERFSLDTGEGTIDINSSETFPPNLAISSGNIGSCEIRVNGTKKPLQSLIILGEERYWTFLNIIPDESHSLYTVEYVLSDEPLHQSLTETPFSVYVGGYIFDIYTPFNIEGQQGVLIPLTIRTYTTRTYALRIEFDPAMIAADRTEIMVYASRFHYEYFMLTPLQTGQSHINFTIKDVSTMETVFSSSFLLTTRSASLTQIVIYCLFAIAIFSLVYVFFKRKLAEWISRLRH